MTGVEFRVLGQVEAVAAGEPVPLAGRGQRALLATLLLHLNETVSIDRLVESIWGDSTPASARHVLHTYVSQLRRALGERAVRTQRPGYVLEVDPGRVDAARFEDRLRAARAAADPERSLSLVEEGLAEWRGPVADGVYLEGDALNAARRLETLRLEALEVRADAKLALGQHAELIADLERLVAGKPLRDRARAQLMVALYRSGRQSDALAVYREARQYYSSELGLEPGEELRRLERAILDHDPSLSFGERLRAPAPARSRRKRAAAVGAAVAVAVAVAAAAAAVSNFGLSARSTALRAGGVGVLDGRTGRVLASPLRAGSADALAVDAGGAWIARREPTSVVEIDGLHVRRSVSLTEPVYALAAADRSLWIAPAYDGTIVQIVGDMLRRPFRPTASTRGRLSLVVVGHSLWVAGQDGHLVQIETSTHRVLKRVHVGTSNALASGYGAIWVASQSTGALVALDPRNGRVVAHVDLPTPAAHLAGDGNRLWVTLLPKVP